MGRIITPPLSVVVSPILLYRHRKRKTNGRKQPARSPEDFDVRLTELDNAAREYARAAEAYGRAAQALGAAAYAAYGDPEVLEAFRTLCACVCVRPFQPPMRDPDADNETLPNRT